MTTDSAPNDPPRHMGALRANDPAAWRDFHDEHRRWLLGSIERYLPGRHRRRIDPEDVLQSVCTEIHQRVVGDFEYRSESELRAYMKRIVHAKVSERIRYDRRSRRDLDAEDLSVDTDHAPATKPAFRTPSSLFRRKERNEVLWAEVGALPPNDRELVLARVIEERSWKEIAVACACTCEAARKRLLVVLAKLADRMRGIA